MSIAAAPGGAPGGRARRIDPRDKAQLAASPVSIRRIVGLFRDHQRPLAGVLALIVATSLISLAQPFLVRHVVDVAIVQQNVRLLVTDVVLMILVAVVTQVFGVVQTWMSASVGEHVMHRLRTDVFGNLQRQSVGFFTRTRAGEVQSRITNDINGMQDVVTNTATSIASNLTSTVATAAAMLAISWRLSLLSLLVIPPAVWLTRQVALMRRSITAEQQATLADLNVQIEEGLSVSGIRLAKTLGSGPHNAERFGATSRALVDLELRSSLAGRWRMATMQTFFAVIPALIYLVAGMPATSGGMTIGTLIAFTGLQATLFRPLLGLLNVGAQVVSSMALFSRVFEYLDLVPDVPAPARPVALDPAGVRGDVAFENVGFRYAGADVDALTAISVNVPAGRSLAVVGTTGSGKSTLASLVPRLYDPTSGRVTIDGVDVRDLAPETLASIVGVVSQETYLVHASIRENLLLAKPDADDAQLWAALATAQVADLVASLPEGLDTVVGARGYRFSGGEQQRLAVARTVLRDPRVLVLDEATSALDNHTERALQTALDRLRHGRTTITIAHRLSTIEDADEIVVLDQGRVVERGTRTELLGEHGRFAALAASAAHAA